MTLRVAVVGAGVAGLACAARLQQRGARVTLVDPAEPGSGCSYGNAGCLSRASVVPVGMPGLWKKVPGYLLDPAGPFRIDWRHAPRAAPWLWRLLRASTPGRVEAIADALLPLLDPSVRLWRELAGWAGVPELIRQDGYAFVYESEAAFTGDALGRTLRERRGVKIEVLTGGDIRAFDPALSPRLTHLVWLPEQGHVPNPQRLSSALATRLRAGGATFMAARAQDFELGEGRVRQVITDRGPVPTDAVVIAAGAHAGPLAAKLGARVPLDTERGYHVMLPATGEMPRIPVCSGEGKFFATPMEGGLRVAGTVELGGLLRPPNHARSSALVPLAQRLLPGIDTAVESRWMGHRPSMPDSLPVLGPAPRVANAYLDFGHGHVGLTAAPACGGALAELICTGQTALDLTPYAAARFT